MSEKGESSSSNIKACAACRHQRRRCHPGCILGRYFPVERTAQFDAVHRLFGISNLIRFYNAAPSEQRDEVIATLTFEAESRRDHPVLGCVAIIHDLNVQIDATRRELDATFSQLAFYRRRQQEQQLQIQMQQLLLAARQQQQQQQMMMMMPPPLAPMQELHAHPFPQQQQPPLPPALPPPGWMNLDDRGVDIGRMKEGCGNWHRSRPSDEAIRSLNREPAPPNPVVPGSSNQRGLHELRGIQGWSAQDQGIDEPKAETGGLFIHNFYRKPPPSA